MSRPFHEQDFVAKWRNAFAKWLNSPHEGKAPESGGIEYSGIKALLMLIGAFAFAVIVVLVTFGPGPPMPPSAQPEQPQTSTYEIERIVQNALKDPDSAKFRNVRVVTKPNGDFSAGCGEVNAKNGFGGYTGFQRFLAGGIVLIDDGGDLFREAWAIKCAR